MGETETQRILAMILEDDWTLVQRTDLEERPCPFYISKTGRRSIRVPLSVATWIASCDKVEYTSTPKWKVWKAKKA